MVQLRYGVVSITGNFRENNEDAYFVGAGDNYFLVADGMGGQSAGEKASAIAIEVIPKKLDQMIEFNSEDADDVVAKIDSAVENANAEIMALGEIEPSYRNMGTTIVFAVRVRDDLFVGGVGDSRAYQLKDDTLTQLTTDHSLTQALLDAGTITEDDAATHRYRNVLYRYLGAKEGGTGTHAQRIQVEPGTRYMLCSDGVTDGLADSSIGKLLQEHQDPEQAAQAIVEAAQQGGSKDNITCLVIYVE